MVKRLAKGVLQLTEHLWAIHHQAKVNSPTSSYLENMCIMIVVKITQLNLS